ncbi:MAG: ATP-binding protein [Candidatus Lariskella arthropodorum]
MKDQIKTGEPNTGTIIHALKQISHGIQSNIQAELKSYYKNPDKVAIQDLITEFEYTLFHLAEMNELINAITSNNWDAKTFTIKNDLYEFIENYLNNAPLHNLSVKLQNCSTRICIFRPLEIQMLINNIRHNAIKAGATELLIRCEENKISFIDNGHGFDFNKLSKNDYLKKGISTSHSTGIGLDQCVQIAQKLKANFSIDNRNDNSKGAAVTLSFQDK